MKSSIQNLLNKIQFFNIIKSTNKSVTYALEKPSQVLIHNIYVNWLRYIHLKTQKHMPIYIQKAKIDLYNKTKDETLPFGIIQHKELQLQNKHFEYIFDNPDKLDLELKLVIPKQDIMQYFVQWQRYRKYWWSSVTTTPSLFSIGEINQTDAQSDADIIAKLPCGSQTVEHIKVVSQNSEQACLTCTMSLERALFVLLLDGNNAKDDYLRLHRKIAPYKMSFALSFEDLNKKETLKKLATLLYYRLNMEKISASLPDFSLSIQDQIKENLHLGIPYTAILNETTLQNGIFSLMNSSTTLKEQIHVADFHTYAALICNDK